MLMSEEIKNAFAELAGQLNFYMGENEDVVSGKYHDQDGRDHLILISKWYDKEQLNEVYNTTFLTGDICWTRSELLKEKNLSNVKDDDGKQLLVDPITVASMIQSLSWGPSDMRLMSMLLSWLYKK